jgi:hypothetical protein
MTVLVRHEQATHQNRYSAQLSTGIPTRSVGIPNRRSALVPPAWQLLTVLIPTSVRRQTRALTWKIILGGRSGGNTPLAALALACVSSRGLASGQFNGSMAVTGICWLSMVRRRSTVRFRKGAPRSEPFFESEPVSYSDGRNRSGFGELRGRATAQAHGDLWPRVGAGERALRGAVWGARSSLGRLRSTPKAHQSLALIDQH